MRKITWIPLVILVAGLVLAGAGWAAGGHRVSNVGLYWQDGTLHVAGVNSKGEVGKVVTIDESFKASDVNSIELNINYLDNITIKEGDVGSDIRVKGANYEEYGELISNMSGDTLSVYSKKNNLDKYWFVNLGFLVESESCYLEITIPTDKKLKNLTNKVDASYLELRNLDCGTAIIDNAYGNIKISGVDAVNMELLANAGQINADSINVAGTLKIDDDYGNINMSNISAEDITVDADAGSIDLRSVTSKRGINIDNDYGDVICDDISAKDINISLDAGLLNVDRISTDTATFKNEYGNIDIDRFTLNGLCEVKSDAGKIYIGLTNEENSVGYNLKASTGMVSIGGSDNSSGNNITKNAPGEKAQIDVKNSFGDIKLDFGR